MSNKRKEKDVTKLLVSDYEVKIVDDKTNNEMLIKMKGPQNSPYEGVSHIPSLHSCIGGMGSSCDVTRLVPLQVSFNWFCQQDLSSQY